MFLTLTIILLVGLAGYLLFVATRQRLFLSIALRNIRRRKATSLLVVLGAMVGTAMISSSLAVGDTLDYSIKQEVYKRLGALDSFVVTEAASENASLYAAETLEQVFFSAEVGEYVREQTGETVDGVLAALIAYVSAAKIEEPGGEPVLAQPVVTLLGADLEAYQEFFTTQPLPDMTTEDIIISEKLADRLEAGPGDWLRFSLWGQTKEFQVKMVLPDDQVPGINFEGYTALLSLDSVHGLLTLFGKLDTLIPPAFLATVPDEAKEYFFTELEKTRSLLQQLPPHPVNMLMISSAGSVAGGAETSEASIAAVKTALDRYNTENQVELRFRVRELKKDAVAIAEQAGAGFTALFIILGGFTIAAGILLIVNIFIMLAEERKREIGILRAMGMKRRTLTSLFAVEGLLYTLVASSLGALGGIAATWLVIAGVQQVLRTFSLVSSFEIQFTFELTSLLIAFGAGVAITFAAIIFASVKLSRMQIVHALRELLRSQTTRFSPRALILPVLGFLLGLLLCGIGFTRSWPELELLGPSLLVVCIAFGLRHWVNERLLFSLASAAVLAYTILAPVYLDRYFQGEFIFILTGLFLVVATVILLVFNEVLLIAPLSFLLGRIRSLRPLVRLVISYPLSYRFRSAMTIIMFAVVIFAVTIISVLKGVQQEAMRTQIARQTDGYELRLRFSQAIPGFDLATALAGREDVRMDDFDRIRVRQQVDVYLTEEFYPELEPMYRTLTIVGTTPDFIEQQTALALRERLDSFATDEAVWQALEHDANGIILGRQFSDEEGRSEGYLQFDPGEEITLCNASDKQQCAVYTVYGITSGWGQGPFVSQRALLAGIGISPYAYKPIYELDIADGLDIASVARALEKVLINEGVQVINTMTMIEEGMRLFSIFLTLVQAYLGAGLLVGISGLGVIMIRSVHERRYHIGLLRAMGFRQGQVVLSVFLETGFVALLGIMVGVGLGIATAYIIYTHQFTAEVDAAASFFIPWVELGIIISISLVASMLTSIWPARQTARIVPSETLRRAS